MNDRLERHYLRLASLAAAIGDDEIVELRYQQAEEARRLRDLSYVTFKQWEKNQS